CVDNATGNTFLCAIVGDDRVLQHECSIEDGFDASTRTTGGVASNSRVLHRKRAVIGENRSTAIPAIVNSCVATDSPQYGIVYESAVLNDNDSVRVENG